MLACKRPQHYSTLKTLHPFLKPNVCSGLLWLNPTFFFHISLCFLISRSSSSISLSFSLSLSKHIVSLHTLTPHSCFFFSFSFHVYVNPMFPSLLLFLSVSPFCYSNSSVKYCSCLAVASMHHVCGPSGKDLLL